MSKLLQIKVKSQADFPRNGLTAAEFYNTRVELIKTELEPLIEILEGIGLRERIDLNPPGRFYRQYNTKPLIIARLNPEEEERIKRLHSVEYVSS